MLEPKLKENYRDIEKNAEVLRRQELDAQKLEVEAVKSGLSKDEQKLLSKI